MPTLSPAEVRTARADLGLTAAEAAALVGLNDGAAWRKWERLGVSGPAAVLLLALTDSEFVLEYFEDAAFRRT